MLYSISTDIIMHVVNAAAIVFSIVTAFSDTQVHCGVIATLLLRRRFDVARVSIQLAAINCSGDQYLNQSHDYYHLSPHIRAHVICAPPRALLCLYDKVETILCKD
jgi:hypothetical protein